VLICFSLLFTFLRYSTIAIATTINTSLGPLLYLRIRNLEDIEILAQPFRFRPQGKANRHAFVIVVSELWPVLPDEHLTLPLSGLRLVIARPPMSPSVDDDATTLILGRDDEVTVTAVLFDVGIQVPSQSHSIYKAAAYLHLFLSEMGRAGREFAWGR
jgi:hypothetical protein